MDVPASVESFLSGYDPHVRRLALGLRELVLRAAPGAIEQVDLPARMLAYSWSPTYAGMICVIMPLKLAVNLGFPRGAVMSDSAGLLSGTGKRARHVRISDEAQIDAPALHNLLAEAVQMTPR